VEQFSLGEYASALLQGSDLPEDRKKALADKLQSYTGLPAAYWIKANLARKRRRILKGTAIHIGDYYGAT
jgi:hypothetical protein